MTTRTIGRLELLARRRSENGRDTNFVTVLHPCERLQQDRLDPGRSNAMKTKTRLNRFHASHNAHPTRTSLAQRSIMRLLSVSAMVVLCGLAPADDIFVSCGGDNTIRRVRPDGSAKVFASRTAALKTNPFGLVFDNQGDLYVSDNANNNGTTISRITPDAVATTFAGGLSGPPLALTIDAAGNLYVGLNVGNQINRVARDGTVLAYATGVNRPFGLAFDRMGNLYAASLDIGRITKIAPDGSTAVFVSGLQGPYGLAFGDDGSLFVSNVYAHTISRVTPEGAVTTFAAMGLANPEGLAFDTDGVLYVANNGNGTISKVTPDGTVTTLASGLRSPSFIAIARPIPPKLQVGNGWRSGQFEFLLISHGGLSYQVEWSLDLANWSQLTTVHSVTGPTQVLDASATGPSRFYRAVQE